MPSDYINTLSYKYNVSTFELEKDWDEAKKSVDKNSVSYWPEVVTVFKKLIKDHYGIVENHMSFQDYKNLTEEFEDQVEIPTKEMQKKNLEDKYNNTGE